MTVVGNSFAENRELGAGGIMSRPGEMDCSVNLNLCLIYDISQRRSEHGGMTF